MEIDKGRLNIMESQKGYVDHIIYRNAENGYTVLVLICEGEELTCVGIFKDIEQGETLEVTGEYVDHPVYGTQLKVKEYRSIPPEDAASMERYLGSGAMKGIGPALAARIVKKFGGDTFRIIEEEPERLVEIKGISEKKAREIATQAEEKKDMREAMVFLQQYGISNTLAVKIYNTYGMNVYGIMRENPYKLAEDISGIGFRIADEIASYGFGLQDTKRHLIYAASGNAGRTLLSTERRTACKKRAAVRSRQRNDGTAARKYDDGKENRHKK